MRCPTIEIVEFGELIHGKIQDFLTLRHEVRIVKLLSRVDGSDSQIARQVVVVDVADRMVRVVVEIKRFLEQAAAVGMPWAKIFRSAC